VNWRFHHCGLACAALISVDRHSSEAAVPDPRDDRVAASAALDSARAREVWAFQPVVMPSVPKAQSSRFKVQNPVDALVLARLQEKGLEPAPPASKAELIRRLCFDLTGLPPSPEEVQAFVQARSPRAYERLVDRLFNSPHFGERWAQHWLDVVRYAETEGFEYDRHLPEAWRYRDIEENHLRKAAETDKPVAGLLKD